MEDEVITKEEIAHNIKNPYITPVAIFMFIFSLTFYCILFFSAHLLYKLPIYMYIFLVFWVVINIISYLQEKSKKVKTNKAALIRYIIISTLCGYSLSISCSSVYVFGATTNGYDVFDYWLIIIIANIISLIGFNIFVISEFGLIQSLSGSAGNIMGIVVALCGFGILIYLSRIVPYTAEENDFIWMSIIVILMINLLIGRSYFNLMRYQVLEELELEEQHHTSK
ncbi:DUF5079 family protein [Staphylococcus lugdunensis]|uniref:DUF5079 family protein n=3 Tax=Staphylococcus TaxID=1279 RepID=UPI0008A151AF|nr:MULTISPECIES: DUF5079 family protein [Staphylococcus]ARJ14483.1 DUF5079 domain-containing protein [Staphylococcus lugdunensis]MCH8665978.1 DUF5079 family protein [Staphylococcus lugdunensis]OFJ65566.1 hypothetical protein HMPREF2855_04135 [Staphylococcus sp. HMSC077E11]OFM43760.1 hypothetical protein HMPREF2688_04495 [Staphylococcus sp. HMSC077E12]OFR90687.1 hypothetical protein HMPREF2864_05760 [Staphylococcus sp. HMSC059F04]